MRNDLGARSAGSRQQWKLPGMRPGPEGLFPLRLCELQTPPRRAGGVPARLGSALGAVPVPRAAALGPVLASPEGQPQERPSPEQLTWSGRPENW